MKTRTRTLITLLTAIALALAAGAHAGPRKGQIVVDPDNPRWLKYQGGGPFFMAGPGDPEGFLYRGRRLPDGTREGDQRRLIRKLGKAGGNSIYLMAVRSHGGDGNATENPFIGNDPKRGLNKKVLAQWERWFRQMDRLGIVIFFIFYDDSSMIWRTGDRVEAAERRFVRALVDRFEHHKHLIWVVAEEYQERYSAARVSGIAREIRTADDHDHPIAVHILNGLKFGEFADDPHLDQFAIQLHGKTARDLHEGMLIAWRDSEGRYNLNMSEAPNWGKGAVGRKKAWAVAMGGAYVMVFEMDIANSPRADLRYCGILARFMESTDFHHMEPRDDLAREATEYVLARPGESYIAYAAEGRGPLGVAGLDRGSYRLRWLDIASGAERELDRDVTGGTVKFERPKGVGAEAALYLRRLGDRAAAASTSGSRVAAVSPGPSASATPAAPAQGEAGSR